MGLPFARPLIMRFAASETSVASLNTNVNLSGIEVSMVHMCVSLRLGKTFLRTH